ncbi:MAG: integrase arm-type DNA-binding domain-containing protein [Betaproteobacteria bacterium]|nr:integrase arm-type DNA-binding domain-containing protein [Betaproteobacteria bacterium]
MPKKAKELSARGVAKIKSQGRYAVGGVDGLHLQVMGCSRSWVLRVAVGTRINSQGRSVLHRRDMGLGSYPEVSLAEAREKARQMRQMLRDGIDPIVQKQQECEAARIQQAKSKTFEECARVVIANKSREFKSPKHAATWRSTLENYAFPVIGNKPVKTVTRADIVAVLEPIWESKNDTASKLRCRIEAVFDYAKAMEYLEGDNPAAWKGTLEPILGRIKRNKQSQPALPYSEIGSFITELRKRTGIAPRALEFLILSAVRMNEVLGATWDEFDMQSKVWTIPAERMKGGRPHRVPLSEATFNLLQALPRIVGTDYVFPSPGNGKFSDIVFYNVIRRMHQAAIDEGQKGFLDPKQNKIITTHGFRSTFRDWAAEQTHYPRQVCEHALAHKLPDAVEAAYLRTDYLDKRASLMQKWATFCEGSQNEAGRT